MRVYPRVMYSRVRGALVVRSAEHESAVGPEFTDTPHAVEPEEDVDPAAALGERVDALESRVLILEAGRKKGR